jgi:hypothetical protein
MSSVFVEFPASPASPAPVGLELPVVHRRPRGGGEFSLFVAGCCGRGVRLLRLLDGAPICTTCCRAKGIVYRCNAMSPRQRAQASVIRLTAKLAMTYPRKGAWGKAPLARRSRYEAALREAELRVAMYAKRSRKRLAKGLEPPPEPARIKRPNRRAVHPAHQTSANSKD